MLRVRVNDDLTLDAGLVERREAELVIHAPKATLFEQVLSYLRSKPDPASRTDLTAEHEGIAAAAVAFRWGSYLAVLVDAEKPLWSDAGSPGTSRVSDSEMARINIEASAALAEWIGISRDDGTMYERLVARAIAYLPMPKMRPTPRGPDFAMLAMPEVAAKLIEGTTGPDRLARVRAEAQGHPNRVFANALVNFAWRNGPVENIHAGQSRGYPPDRRRVTQREERALLDFAADRLATGMEIGRGLALEQDGRSWAEQVVPYGLAEAGLITPTGWTLTEATRDVRLPVV